MWVVLYDMNKNEIGEIEDIIGMLGSIEEHNGGYAEECAFRLFALIKPHIEADILVGDECQWQTIIYKLLELK